MSYVGSTKDGTLLHRGVGIGLAHLAVLDGVGMGRVNS